VVKAIFFDRDGVLNELVERPNGEKTAPWNLDEFKPIPGATAAIELVRDLGYKAFCVTNQPDVDDGKLPQIHLNIMMQYFMDQGLNDALVAYERGSAWYKPNNGMLETLIKKHKINRDISYMIGDRWKDIVAGHRSKLNTIYIGKNYKPQEKYNNIHPDYIVGSVLEAACLIEELHKDD
jgi:D-glycero-D-manno-heptose 1,7-bisphosphate phosphatase